MNPEVITSKAALNTFKTKLCMIIQFDIMLDPISFMGLQASGMSTGILTAERKSSQREPKA